MRPERLTLSAAARLIGVSPQTISTWWDKGLLQTARYEGDLRHATVERGELEQLLKGAAYAVAVRKAEPSAKAVNRVPEYELVAREHENFAKWLRSRKPDDSELKLTASPGP